MGTERFGNFLIIYISYNEVIILNSCELVQLISAIACIIAKDKTSDELALLSAFFTQLGDTLTTIAAVNDSK